MKHRSIHENLDTSFVNLSALLRYLRRRQFVGKVRVELSGYEADIYLGAGNHLRAREYDQIAGRIAEGEEALQRILIRSREPGGIVNVYQEISEKEAAEANVKNENPPKPAPVQNVKPAPVNIPKPNGKPEVQTVAATAENPPPRKKLSLEHFAFELRNKVEDKAKQPQLSPKDWQMLLSLTSELLETIDKTLASASLNFAAALEKARVEISADYPFLNPKTNVFEYKEGKVSMREQTSAKLFTASIVEILQRILEKLGANPKFTNIHHQTKQRILALIHHRRAFYDKFSITKSLEKIL
jgi:hypothetical protein